VPFPSSVLFFFFKQKTAYEIGLGIPAEPLFRSMQCDRLMLMVGLSFLTLSRWLTTDWRRFMILPMLCVSIFVILVVWFLLPRVARLMIHTPTAISIFVCLSMVQLMAVFSSMRCTLCGHFLQVALTLILVVGYAIAASSIACKIRGLMVTVCPSRSEERRVGKEWRSRR